MPIRVVIVDDSVSMRHVLKGMIESDPEFEVVGVAPDAMVARDLVRELRPDVLTLDVNMPGMNGLEFLDRLMRLNPLPVVMVSSFTREGSETTLRALELGAVDFLAKPAGGGAEKMHEFRRDLHEILRAAKGARFRRCSTTDTFRKVAPQPLRKPPALASRPAVAAHSAVGGSGGELIFVGASTGGTEAIREFLAPMPENCPPILIVQHMPETFTGSFARRLDSLVAPRVVESAGNELVVPGTVYIAPGHSHLMLKRMGNQYFTVLSQSEPVNRHRPAVDVLFHSAAELVGTRALGVILTGMGRDGAIGLLRMREAGARTFGQDESSCVVYGMPREAERIGAVSEVLGIAEMGGRVLSFVR